MNDIDMSEHGIYLHCGDCGAEKRVWTIIDGDVLCETCFRRDYLGEPMLITKSQMITDIRDNVKEILKKLEKLEKS